MYASWMVLAVITISISIGFVLGIAYCKKHLFDQLTELEISNCKMRDFYEMLLRWHFIKKTDSEVEKYLFDKGYRSIAIYGMKELGMILYHDLEDSSVTVKYAIDRRASSICSGIRIVSPDASLEPVDAVVVTVIQNAEEIRESLSKVLKCPVVSLEEILFSL